MAEELILLDTSILIDYFRKTNKKNSSFYQLSTKKLYAYAVSVITEYEIFVGATEDQINFWSTFFTKVKILTFDSQCAKEAVRIQQQLRRKNNMIAIPDLLIGATAKSNGLKIATINQKHFQRISDLRIVTH